MPFVAWGRLLFCLVLRPCEHGYKVLELDLSSLFVLAISLQVAPTESNHAHVRVRVL